MKDLEKEIFNEYWNDLIMNQSILFLVFINIQDDLSVVKGDLYSVKDKEFFSI
jgi:hypothetical protein